MHPAHRCAAFWPVYKMLELLLHLALSHLSCSSEVAGVSTTNNTAMGMFRHSFCCLSMSIFIKRSWRWLWKRSVWIINLENHCLIVLWFILLAGFVFFSQILFLSPDYHRSEDIESGFSWQVEEGEDHGSTTFPFRRHPHLQFPVPMTKTSPGSGVAGCTVESHLLEGEDSESIIILAMPK